MVIEKKIAEDVMWENENQVLKEQAQASEAALEGLRESLQMCRQDAAEKDETIAGLRAHLGEMQLGNTTATKLQEELQGMTTKLQEELQGMKAKAAEQEQVVADLKKEVEAMEWERAKQQEENVMLRGKLRKSEEELLARDEEIEDLKASLEDRNKKLLSASQVSFSPPNALGRLRLEADAHATT